MFDFFDLFGAPVPAVPPELSSVYDGQVATSAVALAAGERPNLAWLLRARMRMLNSEMRASLLALRGHRA
jgi:hypothetical protein